MWRSTSIGTAFAGCDNHVLFAAANEPEIKMPTKMKALMSYYPTFVDTVRAAGGKNVNCWLALPSQETTFGEESDIDTGYQQLQDRFVGKSIPVMIAPRPRTIVPAPSPARTSSTA